MDQVRAAVGNVWIRVAILCTVIVVVAWRFFLSPSVKLLTVYLLSGPLLATLAIALVVGWIAYSCTILALRWAIRKATDPIYDMEPNNK